MFLQSVVDTVREPFVVLDADQRIVSANRAFYRTFEAAPGQILGECIYELGGGQWDIPELRRLLEEVVPSDSAFDDFEVAHEFPGIGRKIMLLNARKLYRPGNHTEMILLAMEDVTERRRVEEERGVAEAALRAANERLRILIEGAREHAIILLDAEGRIAEWSGGAERILGWGEAEVVGQSGDLFFTPEDRAAGVPEEELDRAAREGRSEDVRWHLRKDGTRFFADGAMTSLRDETGGLRGFTKVLRDATARKVAEDGLQAAYERERRIADALQRTLTQEIAEDAFPGLLVATLFEPALDEAQVGGDFFDAFPVPGGRVALAIADASGKGLSAAARTIQLKDVLRAFTREQADSPAEIIARLNAFMCDTKQYDENSNEAFSCFTLVILNPQTGEGTVTSAGCEPPLLLHAGGDAEELSAPGLPLGILREEEYRNLPLRLLPGDTLLLVTDGITEARRERRLLGYEGMIALAKEASHSPSLREMGRAILEGARAFGGGALLDDACLVLARRS